MEEKFYQSIYVRNSKVGNEDLVVKFERNLETDLSSAFLPHAIVEKK
jgi:hypothetical protein